MAVAFLLPSLVLAIGPLSRIDRRFLPLLCNRRHFGVITAVVAGLHAKAVPGWYVAFAPISQVEALFPANTKVMPGLVTSPWHRYQYRLGDGYPPPPFKKRLHKCCVRLDDSRICVDPVALPLGTIVEPVPIPPDRTPAWPRAIRFLSAISQSRPAGIRDFALGAGAVVVAGV